MKETDKAYLAGILDGEGSIYIIRQQARQSPSHTLVVAFIMCDSEALKLFQQSFGGKINQTRRTVTGKATYIYRLVAIQAAYLLQELLPYLRIKRKQAELGIAFRKAFKPSSSQQRVSSEEIGRREGFRKAISQLNRKGKKEI